MDPHERATSVWYRVAGLLRRKDLAIEIVEAEIRSAQHEVLLEAAKLVLSGEPIEIARRLRERAERIIRRSRKSPTLLAARRAWAPGVRWRRRSRPARCSCGRRLRRSLRAILDPLQAQATKRRLIHSRDVLFEHGAEKPLHFRGAHP
jgi:hypothetical protein